MRVVGLGLVSSLFLTTLAMAQQTPPRLAPAAPVNPAPPAAVPADPVLDSHLRRWEKEMENLQTLYVGLKRTDTSAVFKTVTNLEGSAYYMKNGSGAGARSLALLEMFPAGKKTELVEKIVCTGTFLYLFNPSKKQIQFLEMPKPKPGAVADDNSFALMFGMKTEEAKRRYQLRVAKEDPNYIEIQILPRFAEDKAEFETATLWLDKTNFKPAQLHFVKPNKDATTWRLQNLQTNVRLDPRWFDKPTLPAGWTFSKMPTNNGEPPPRIQRNNGNP